MDNIFLKYLDRLCISLDGTWRVNRLYTEKSFSNELSNYQDKNSYYIYCNEKVYIRIRKVIKGKSSLSIGYIDNKTLYFYCQHTINLNFEKSFNRVLSDIKSRLICDFESVIKTKEKKEAENKRNKQKSEFKSFVINSIKKAIKCDVVTDSYCSYRLVRNEQYSERLRKVLNCDAREVTKAKFAQLDSGDKFHLDLYDLTAEQLIKVIVALDY